MNRLAPLLASIALLPGAAIAQDPNDSQTDLPRDRTAGDLEAVATFTDQMPTGVTVSKHGRVFVCYPRWGDKVEYTVAEIKDGKPQPYPNADIHKKDPDDPSKALISVQSVIVDPADRLWILDPASIEFQGPVPGAAKLVRVNLETDEVEQTITFPRDVVLPTTYLNDVRFDLRRGEAGLAYITDSSPDGPNGLIVVDLASGESWRKLGDHVSTRPEPDFVPIVEGRVLVNRPKDGRKSPITIGSDGIAIGPDGRQLYYCPLAGRHLFSVNLDALSDRNLSDTEVARSVVDLGTKGACDGMECDTQGRIYITAYEHNSILRWSPNGTIETIAHDPRLLWPDTLSLGQDGHLYIIANQLHRQPKFHNGLDRRETPYVLFRLKVDAEPVLLKPKDEK